MSGLTIEHDGMIPVKEMRKPKNETLNLDQTAANTGTFTMNFDIAYNFFLAPKFVVAEVRMGSPAALAGIQQGDEIYKVNGKHFYNYKLYELIDLFSNKVGRKIFLELSRDGRIYKADFVLKRVL